MLKDSKILKYLIKELIFALKVLLGIIGIVIISFLVYKGFASIKHFIQQRKYDLHGGLMSNTLSIPYSELMLIHRYFRTANTKPISLMCPVSMEKGFLVDWVGELHIVKINKAEEKNKGKDTLIIIDEIDSKNNIRCKLYCFSDPSSIIDSVEFIINRWIGDFRNYEMRNNKEYRLLREKTDYDQLFYLEFFIQANYYRSYTYGPKSRNAKIFRKILQQAKF